MSIRRTVFRIAVSRNGAVRAYCSAWNTVNGQTFAISQQRKAVLVARSSKKKMTTSEALESLLGKKAAKRLRQLARQIADMDDTSAKKNKR